MWGVATILVILITAGITGYLALISLRDPVRAMATFTHRPELLPQIMAGRYLALFLLALGVLVLAQPEATACYLAVCAVLGLYDGWVYWSRGLPHARHTLTGLLSFGGFCIVLGAVLWGDTP